MTRSTSFTAHAANHKCNKSRIRFFINRPPHAPLRTPIPKFVSSSGWIQTGLGSTFRKAQKKETAKRQFAPRSRLRGPQVSSARLASFVAAATIARPPSVTSSPLFHISSITSSLSSLSTLSTLPALSPGSSPPGSPTLSVLSVNTGSSGSSTSVARGVDDVGEKEDDEEDDDEEEEEGEEEEGEEENYDDDEQEEEEDNMMDVDWKFGDCEYMDVDWWEGDMEVDILPPNATSLWF